MTSDQVKTLPRHLISVMNTNQNHNYQYMRPQDKSNTSINRSKLHQKTKSDIGPMKSLDNRDSDTKGFAGPSIEKIMAKPRVKSGKLNSIATKKTSRSRKLDDKRRKSSAQSQRGSRSKGSL